MLNEPSAQRGGGGGPWCRWRERCVDPPEPPCVRPVCSPSVPSFASRSSSQWLLAAKVCRCATRMDPYERWLFWLESKRARFKVKHLQTPRVAAWGHAYGPVLMGIHAGSKHEQILCPSTVVSSFPGRRALRAGCCLLSLTLPRSTVLFLFPCTPAGPKALGSQQGHGRGSMPYSWKSAHVDGAAAQYEVAAPSLLAVLFPRQAI